MKVAKPYGKGVQPEALRVSLCDLNARMVDIWLEVFRDVDAVEVLQGDLLDLEADAVVSPANSFGDMSGGIDKHIDGFYKGAAQNAITGAIREHFLGELPVGAALILEMSSERFPFLIVAPTMRIPGSVADSTNAYLGFRGVLVAIHRHNRSGKRPVRSVAVPGLCTGVGGMTYGVSALQMRAAYENVIGGGWEKVVHPAMAPFALGPTSGAKPWRQTKPPGPGSP
jgi:O-acetyl-ADP-ribose deacetylase (regulator of RNase III)